MLQTTKLNPGNLSNLQNHECPSFLLFWHLLDPGTGSNSHIEQKGQCSKFEEAEATEIYRAKIPQRVN